MTRHDDASTYADLLARLGDDGTKELFRRLLEEAIQELSDAELTAQIGADRHQRSESRLNYRNGVRPRTLSTPAGDVELRIPTIPFRTETSGLRGSPRDVHRPERRLLESRPTRRRRCREDDADHRSRRSRRSTDRTMATRTHHLRISRLTPTTPSFTERVRPLPRHRTWVPGARFDATSQTSWAALFTQLGTR